MYKGKSEIQRRCFVGRVRGGTARLVRTIIFSAFLIWIGIFLQQYDLPRYVSIVIFFVAPLMILLDLITIRAIAKAEEEEALPHITGHLFEDEEIEDVLTSVSHYRDMYKPYLPGELIELHHENILVLTNHALWALTLGYEYEEEDMFNTDSGLYQWLTDDVDLYREFEMMRQKVSEEELFRASRAKKLIDRSDIIRLEYVPEKHVITFLGKGGQHCSYLLKETSDYERAKKVIDMWQENI